MAQPPAPRVTYGADVAQCPRCRRSSTDREIHCDLSLPVASTKASVELCLQFMDFMYESQRAIVKRNKGESLRAFMGGALIATLKAPRGPAVTNRYVGASGGHVPTRRWKLSGVPMVTATAWVAAAANPPLIAGWAHATGGSGFSPKYNGAPYLQTTQQLGNCAAPKLLRALYDDVRANRAKSDHNAHWSITALELTEAWWHPDNTGQTYRVIPSCQYCQELLPQMLCMRL